MPLSNFKHQHLRNITATHVVGAAWQFLTSLGMVKVDMWNNFRSYVHPARLFSVYRKFDMSKFSHLGHTICMVYSYFMTIYIFQGRYIPDLHDPARVAGWEPYRLHDLLCVAHVSWVGPVPCRSCTTSPSGRCGIVDRVACSFCPPIGFGICCRGQSTVRRSLIRFYMDMICLSSGNEIKPP